MKRNLIPFALAAASLSSAFVATPAHAWRETGHWAVCEIASRHVTERTKAALDDIMGGDYATQCTWPDMVRNSAQWKHTYDWHFVNLDDGIDYYDKQSLAPKGDAVRAILQALDVLRKPDTSREDKRIWLRFLGHFFGDIHQPLHVGRKSDLGGNKVTVKWFGEPKYDYAEILRADGAPADCSGEGQLRDLPTGECVTKKSEVRDVSLHKVWDLHVLETYIKKNRLTAEPGDSVYLHKAFATSVDRQPLRAEWQRMVYSVPGDWMEESLAGRSRAYAAIQGAALDDAYYDDVAPVMKERVALAGIRLAATLDRLLDPIKDRSHRAAFLALREAELRARIELALTGN